MNSSPKRTASKPPDSITVAPIGISKLNAEAVCGLTERQLYDLGRAHNLPRLPGKVPVYRADAVLALFVSGAIARAETTDDEPTNAEQVLARLGRRSAGGR